MVAIDYSQGMAITKLNEGFRAQPYSDTVGIQTVGYGFNLASNPNIPHHLTKEQANQYFIKFYQQAIYQAQKFAGPCWHSLSKGRQEVLIDLCYNLSHRIYHFKRFRHALQLGQYEQAKQELIHSKWARQVGHRLERDLMLWNS